MQQEAIKKSLLIIKSKPGGLGSAEGFLKNRDWKIKSTTNLKEALIYLVQEQPQFVMIGIDHPNRKVRNLPKILTQAFPVCVIAFTEATSAADFKMLSSSGCEYLIYPPITGPAVERTANKYIKDMQTKGTQAYAQRMGRADAGEAGVISIKGNSDNMPGANAQNILAQLLNEDNSGGALFSGDSGSPEHNSIQQGHNQGAHIIQTGSAASALHSPMMDPDLDNAPTSFLQSSTPNKDSAGWVPLPEKKNKNDSRTYENPKSDSPSSKSDSIILRGTKDSLEKSCIQTPAHEAEEITHATNVACIVIESSRFSGYLITALGNNRTIDDKFIKVIQDRLFRFLRENGEDVADSESMNMKIKQVPFEDWALDCADFLKKSIHEGNEVAMAFFPRTDVKSQYGESATEEMATIKLEELAGDVAVEFNVYIHLPRNNKYVLYTARGGVFYNAQKERLQSQGVSQLHIHKGDLRDLDKYRAQKFLNEKIQEFEDKEKAKEPA